MVCWGGCGESSLCEGRGEVMKRGFVGSLCVEWVCCAWWVSGVRQLEGRT